MVVLSQNALYSADEAFYVFLKGIMPKAFHFDHSDVVAVRVEEFQDLIGANHAVLGSQDHRDSGICLCLQDLFH